MGAEKAEGQAWGMPELMASQEQPVAAITIAHSYAIGRTEVTRTLVRCVAERAWQGGRPVPGRPDRRHLLPGSYGLARSRFHELAEQVQIVMGLLPEITLDDTNKYFLGLYGKYRNAALRESLRVNCRVPGKAARSPGKHEPPG